MADKGTDGEGEADGAAPERDADGEPTAEHLAPVVLEGDTVEMAVPEAVPREDTEPHAGAGTDAADESEGEQRSSGDTDEDLAAVSLPEDAGGEPTAARPGSDGPEESTSEEGALERDQHHDPGAEGAQTANPTLDTATLAG